VGLGWDEGVTGLVVGVANACVILAKWYASAEVNSALRVVGGLNVTVACSGRQFSLKAVVLLASYNDGDNDVVFVKFGKVAHEKLTVSEVVDVAVTVEIFSEPIVVVLEVTPPEKVAV